MNHRRGGRYGPIVRVQHGQASAGGKPQASIAAPGAAATGGISGSALRASQSIGYSVIHRLHFSDLAAHQIPNVLLADAAYPPRGAQPQRSLAIILDVRH